MARVSPIWARAFQATFKKKSGDCDKVQVSMIVTDQRDFFRFFIGEKNMMLGSPGWSQGTASGRPGFQIIIIFGGEL